MTCPDTRIQPEEPPPPARDPYAGPGASFFVTGCLNCAHCRDDGHPHKPERWVCDRPRRFIDGDLQPALCHEVRNSPNLCALQARWFRDAITGR